MTPSPLCPAAAVGVGGEYPLSASSASERAEADPELRKRRGETTVLTFSGQGWGECLNTTQPGLRACPLAGDDDSGDAAHRCFTMSHSALSPPPPPLPCRQLYKQPRHPAAAGHARGHRGAEQA